MDINNKLTILADAAKYDVSCSSSGSKQRSQKGTLGSTHASGICHSFTPDGRCISLLKILYTNYCEYDCAYCINRKSNDVPRASFTVKEVVDLTMNFYRRNYIEGLFLSSAIVQNCNYTMERLAEVVETLRVKENFRGYIHLKAIPGADQAIIDRAGRHVDRMSVNIELPSSQSLMLLAPEKSKQDILTPMNRIKQNILLAKDEKKRFRKAPLYVPAGQSTQMIVGASKESDQDILNLSSQLYDKFSMKRVYYSAYVPINQDNKLPAIATPPTFRENRLYQGDWLIRIYGFDAKELLTDNNPNFDEHLDPKTIWALNNLHLFPMEVNRTSYENLVRIPGIGIKGAKKIVAARRIAPLSFDDLKKLGIVMKRAQYFITCKGKYFGSVAFDQQKIDYALRSPLVKSKKQYEQLTLLDSWSKVSSEL